MSSSLATPPGRSATAVPRVRRDGSIWIGTRQLNETELRALLEAHGFSVPVAADDPLTDGRAGVTFLRVPKWAFWTVVVLLSIVAAAVIVTIAIEHVVADLALDRSSAIAWPMIIVVSTILYVGTGVWMYVYAFWEKFRVANRLDPRMWLRELRRIRRLARRPPTDGEIEDALIDAATQRESDARAAASALTRAAGQALRSASNSTSVAQLRRSAASR